jgi:pimeloyl-ACP methyl ester carboxylesterase
MGKEVPGAVRCAEVLAPLDYTDPDGRAITLFMARRAATKQPYLGTLFVNPGGPGGSGADLATYFHHQGLEQYDIVGWDPRGTGLSTPVKCLSDKELDAVNELDTSPDDEAEKAVLVANAYDFGLKCAQHSGDYLRYVGTANTVRDLDLLRVILGDGKLNFVGYSYGTELGARYAQAFPDKVGRVVLDGAAALSEADEIPQVVGFEASLHSMASWCAAEEDCQLGDSASAVLGKTTKLFEELEARALRVGKRQLTQSMAVNGLLTALYWGEEGWQMAAEAITEALDGDGRYFLTLADVGAYRDSDGSYDQMAVSFAAIHCLERLDEGVLAADREWLAEIEVAPLMSTYIGPYYVCALWPVKPDTRWDVSARPLEQTVLVVGNTGDNATPYQQSVTLAQRLKNAVLLTFEGQGHTSFGGKSACVDSAVVDFLVSGTLPPPGKRCT